MSITKIRQAIMELSPRELARLRKWFEEYYAEVWGKQIEADAKSGRLNKLITEADEENALIEERRNESERPLRDYMKEKKKKN
jgi:hypothetical protein